jgi:hypothetical protein
MSTIQKLLIAGGVFIVVVTVAIATFSLGVYVGERGWTAGPPSIAGPGGPPKGPAGGPPPGQPGQPGQPPPGGQPEQPSGGGPGQPSFGPLGDLPPGRLDVIGRVRSMAGDSITLDTPQGPRLVTVNKETEVKRAEGEEEEASLEDIEPGTPIAVFGQFNGGGKTLVAQVVVILPSPPRK